MSPETIRLVKSVKRAGREAEWARRELREAYEALAATVAVTSRLKDEFRALEAKMSRSGRREQAVDEQEPAGDLAPTRCEAAEIPIVGASHTGEGKTLATPAAGQGFAVKSS
jgi:hypothetical protein